eukprot:15095048-Heterocapsa_arctica.AAC.1
MEDLPPNRKTGPNLGKGTGSSPGSHQPLRGTDRSIPATQNHKVPDLPIGSGGGQSAADKKEAEGSSSDLRQSRRATDRAIPNSPNRESAFSASVAMAEDNGPLNHSGSHTQGAGEEALTMWAVTGSSSGPQQAGSVWGWAIQDTQNQGGE